MSAKILVVEDDPMLQKIYRTVLTKEGYRVDTASDGREGLQKAMADAPDLIVLDMLMPNMNGIEFLEAFDVLEKHPKTKVIAFSNTELPQWLDKAMELGVKKYVTKFSFSPRALVGLIRDLLEP